MLTVRELIQMLVLNCCLDDKVTVEIKVPIEKGGDTCTYESLVPKRVFHMGYGESVIECHDD